MGTAKGYAIIHAIGFSDGAKTVWADEAQNGFASDVRRAREILIGNFR